MSSNSVAGVIINGYIRSIQKLLNEKIIPNEINVVCLQFYQTVYNLVLLSIIPGKEGIYISDIGYKRHSKLEIKNIHNDRTEKFLEHKVHLNYTGLCLTNNIPLPNYITDQININDSTKLLFECGGSAIYEGCSKACFGYIINEHNNIAHKWTLPQFGDSMDVNGNYLLFNHKLDSDYYGLISISDERNYNIYHLPFTYDKLNGSHDDWKWKTFPRMALNAACPTACILDEYLFVMGGHDANVDPVRYNQVFEFETKEWKSMARLLGHGKAQAGICTKNNNTIYIGGGDEDGDSYSVDYYDINKDKWYDNLPDTNISHPYWPSMWIKDDNLLYIASTTGNAMEYIDLRENATQWNVVYKRRSYIYESLTQSLFDVNPWEMKDDELFGYNYSSRVLHWS